MANPANLNCSPGLPAHKCVAGSVREEFFCVRVFGTTTPLQIRAVTTTNSTLCTDTTTVFTEAVSGAVYSGPTDGPNRATCIPQVQVVGSPDTDNEVITLCNALGEAVVVQYDVTTVPPTEVSRWNLVLNAAEPPGTLSRCTDQELLDVGAPINYCAGGIEYTRTDYFNAQTQAVIGSIWQDDTGAMVTPPVGPTKGTCASLATCVPATALGVLTTW